MTPQLCLVSAAGGSAWRAELLTVVADAVRAAGGRAHTAVGAFPDLGPDTVYVVEPREYVALTPTADLPTAAQLRRTIGFCVDHPGTARFGTAAALADGLAATVAISRDAAAELRAVHFQLGHTPLWDRWGGDPDSPRDLDVTHLGAAVRRRSLLLGSYARDLDGLRTRLITPPDEPLPDEPLPAGRVDHLAGEEKLAHLARSRFVLAVHRERAQPLEWVRTLQAMCNGCVVLTEPTTGLDDLVPGEHLVVARPESLGAVAAALAADGALERHVRTAAYEHARKLDLPGSALALVHLAASLTGRGGTGVLPAAGGARRTADTPPWDVRFVRSLNTPPPTAQTADGAAPTAGDTAAAGSATANAFAQVRHRVVAARRSAGRRWVPAQYGRVRPDVERADVDVLLVRRPGEVDPDGLVSDLLSGTVLPNAVLVGEDGVVPWSRPRPAELLVHDAPLGRGLTRNALLARSASTWLLVLDGGMRASGHLLERLLAGAARAEGADVVHCPVADPVDGLVGALPAEDSRLRGLPYLGSGYLARRSVVDELGGWTEDVLLEGLEDHVFWRRVTAAGRPTVLVQQILIRRVRPDPEPRPVDLDARRTWSLVDATIAGS